MITIHKYELELNTFQDISTHCGFCILDVQVQNGVPCLWVQVDTDQPKCKQGIIIHGTGHPLNEHIGEYIGTVQLDLEDVLVLHVFMEQ